MAHSFFRPRGAAAAVLFAAALLLSARAVPAAGKRPIAETDLFKFVWVGDPRISPDGRQVAFVRVTVNAKKEGYDTALWIVPADASQPPRPFTTGPHDSAPRWSPDGRWIAFLRTREATEKTGEPQEPQLYLIPAAGGEAFQLTELTKGVGPAAWSPEPVPISSTFMPGLGRRQRS